MFNHRRGWRAVEAAPCSRGATERPGAKQGGAAFVEPAAAPPSVRRGVAGAELRAKAEAWARLRAEKDRSPVPGSVEGGFGIRAERFAGSSPGADRRLAAPGTARTLGPPAEGLRAGLCRTSPLANSPGREPAAVGLRRCAAMWLATAFSCFPFDPLQAAVSRTMVEGSRLRGDLLGSQTPLGARRRVRRAWGAAPGSSGAREAPYRESGASTRRKTCLG